MKFRGTILTDGIGISIVKQNFETEKGKGSRKTKVEEEKFPYIGKIPIEELLSTKDKAVLIDPGRRDLLFCMHEYSTAEEKQMYRYTRNQRAKELKSTKFRKLRQQWKPSNVQETETKLSKYSSLTINCEEFIQYIKTRALVSPTLYDYYANEDVTNGQRKENYLPFRKMKLSSYINQGQADKRLSENLKKFGDECVLIFGDWSSPSAKFHEHIKGKDMRRMLRNQGHKVYLMNEYKTSSICPDCDSKLEYFKECINPRPRQRSKRPIVKCHGILRCPNQNCLVNNVSADDCDVPSNEPTDNLSKIVEQRFSGNLELQTYLNYREIDGSKTGSIFKRSKKKKTCSLK